MAEFKPEILNGPPDGEKPTGGQRVDYKVGKLDNFIYTKGQRAWWSRAALCPCQGNPKTDQPALNCSLCNGKGYWYFTPQLGATAQEVDLAGNPIEVNEAADAVGVVVMITSTTQDPQIYEHFGQWHFGTAKLTAQSPNRLGYRDKFSCRDAEMWAGQLITSDGGSEISVVGEQSDKGLWSPATRVTLLRSVATVYREGDDFELTKQGTIRWLGAPPAAGTILSYYGAFHPVWVIIEFPFAYRDTLVEKKRQADNLADQHAQLPMSAVVKLDFLA